jgi:hypothetical protein
MLYQRRLCRSLARQLNSNRIARTYTTSVTTNSVSNIETDLQSIIQQFDAPIRFCCAYGSAVFPQRSASPTNDKQIDLIFGVTHPEHWHSLNLRQNRHHYSSLMRMGGSGVISAVQQSLGASIYYNQGCIIDGKVKRTTFNLSVIVYLDGKIRCRVYGGATEGFG